MVVVLMCGSPPGPRLRHGPGIPTSQFGMPGARWGPLDPGVASSRGGRQPNRERSDR